MQDQRAALGSKPDLQKNHDLCKYGFADVEIVTNENKTWNINIM